MKPFSFTLFNRNFIYKLVVFLPLIIFFSLFYLQKSNFVTSDLGRHLTNGKVILQTHHIPTTNLYSYTYTNHPTLTHHWLAGVIFYFIHSLAGFSGLTLFTTTIYLSAISLLFFFSTKLTSLPATTLATTLALPLIVSRTDIRPESISYLFLALFLIILTAVTSNILSPRWLFLLPLLQLVWVNTHIFFFLGLALILLFTADSFFHHSPSKHLFLTSSLLTLITSFINPYGLHTILAPLSIVNQVQKQSVLENLNVFQFLSVFEGSDFAQFILLFIISLTTLVFLRPQTRPKFFSPWLATTLLLGILGTLMVRNIALFGYLFILVGSFIIHHKTQSSPHLHRRLYLLSLAIIFIGSHITGHYYRINPKYLGLGILDHQNQATAFIHRHQITGPIFNNYDIGGYLIYHLYPDTLVFTDNRPESYPHDFFTAVYFPMQSDDLVWYHVDQQYHFNAIILSYHDFTTHLKSFIQSRTRDPDWVKIYQDQYVIIFIRNTPKNQPLIHQYSPPHTS